MQYLSFLSFCKENNLYIILQFELKQL